MMSEKRKIIIYDADRKWENTIRKAFTKEGEQAVMIGDDGTIKTCIGCFGCWNKTPGQCVLKDQNNEMGRLLGNADEIIVISRCVYGMYSPFVKNVFDRSISYSHPYFTIRDGEIHHKPRYENHLRFHVYFYGECSEEEKESAKRLVKANTINLNGIAGELVFMKNMEEIINENCLN